MENLMNIEQVAEMLGVKVSTIYSWVSQQYIPHYKIGRLVRFDKREVLEWVQNLRVRGRKTRLPKKDPLYMILS